MTGRSRSAAAALLTAALVFATWATTAPSAEAGVEVPAGRDLLVIHDSVVINARGTIRHNLDRWNIEYLGFHGLQAWAANRFLDRRRTPLPDTVLVALNFNDRSREQLRHDLRGLLRRLGPARRIVWILPGIYGPHMIPVRETMLEVVAEDDRVEVADWHDLYRTSPEITDLFGVHLTSWGAWVYAGMIDRVLDRAPAGDPPSRGDLSRVRSGSRGEETTGWALDLAGPEPRRVDVYVDGKRRRRVLADRPRQDVAAAYGLGAEHGFRARFGLDDGVHRVCALTTAGDGRGMQSMGCSSLRVRHDPIGQVGSVRRRGADIEIPGWAFDPDRTGPVDIHAYLDEVFVGGVTAAQQRLDVADVYPGRTHTGFRFDLEGVTAGRTVCLHAIGRGRGGNESLGCHTT